VSKKAPFAVLAVVCVAAVVGALLGGTPPLSATQFANTGHWVYNSVLQTVFHIDGATTNIDAQLAMGPNPAARYCRATPAATCSARSGSPGSTRRP